MPTIRLPRLTRDSLEGTPGGAYQTAQKDASVSWSRYMIVLLVTQSKRIVACEARCREQGKLKLEGKEYVVQDGDVVHFRFNV